MGYAIRYSKQFENSIAKLKRKDRLLYGRIWKKIGGIIDNPEHYKPLRYSLAGYRRVHVGSFVVIYSVRGEVIKFISLDHHDNAY